MKETQRVIEMQDGATDWRLWGPYLSERQWGTVREDYSKNGDAWSYLPHDHARSRAYRWGEDGIAGLCDIEQRLCLSIALWNGRDHLLKERLFGLTNSEGNHGEDVKEVYYYLDATPSHSYLKMLYKYPQAAFPYEALVEQNRHRTRQEPEFELTDTGIFNENRYFDVFVEYAKGAVDDILMRITVQNRGPEEAVLHVLPQIWFRNTWSWGRDPVRPELRGQGNAAIEAAHASLGKYTFQTESADTLLFTENDTNAPKLFHYGETGAFYKDAFHEFLVNGRKEALSPDAKGTKAAAHHKLTVSAGESKTIRARLIHGVGGDSFQDFDETFELRQREADEFYRDLQKDIASADARLVQRQALAGMIWTKQFYYYEVAEWLNGDPGEPTPPVERKSGRNSDWKHVINMDILSMPDKWEYPWYASWDLAFHAVGLSLIDPGFAKDQLVLMVREWYMHPNGQLPAYEWNFSDVNPPVHGWATWRVFEIDRKLRRRKDPCDPGDLVFLERVFHKLMLNFTWWVNRKDAAGHNIFQGGFLGLDNVGVFDRSAPLPTGGYINQADGTSWMAMYSLNLMRIALELAQHNHVYEDIATKFFEHFLSIAEAMTNIGDAGIGLWDESDGFYYDVLNMPNGTSLPLKVRSVVGLTPLFAVETLEPELLERVPEFKKRLEWYLGYRPDLAALVSRWNEAGAGERRLLSLLRGHRMKLLLKRMLDETEFLSAYGVRSLSRVHLEQPYVFKWNGDSLTVRYQPGDSDSNMFGGNSNWRGPIWFPVNFLIVESLQKFYHYYGDDFKVECPTGSGHFATLKEIADELRERLGRIFMADETGCRPALRNWCGLQGDLYFKDHVLFYEFFHGDTAQGLGASHQTGWTGLIAKLLHPRSKAIEECKEEPLVVTQGYERLRTGGS
jgi:Glycosyl hydrolase family 63 C-terminal domain